ncbi:hypothetical protein SCP_0112350 [Sparassis crispa]|uniref:Uncharacterized protein n=1 Tax=Sparassis crispa TaxID=139825 RepID=A0A401G838_9APHY|nr:hypothetical protein SCP_0112350 [Sparassis crispa]GBE78350.1 hypothetical protein SCP_0112350 [Sparassis crispa]
MAIISCWLDEDDLETHKWLVFCGCPCWFITSLKPLSTGASLMCQQAQNPLLSLDLPTNDPLYVKPLSKRAWKELQLLLDDDKEYGDLFDAYTIPQLELALPHVEPSSPVARMTTLTLHRGRSQDHLAPAPWPASQPRTPIRCSPVHRPVCARSPQ